MKERLSMKNVGKSWLIGCTVILTLALSSCQGEKQRLGETDLRGVSQAEDGTEEGEYSAEPKGPEGQKQGGGNEPEDLRGTVQGSREAQGGSGSVSRRGEGGKIKAALDLGTDNTLFVECYYKAGDISKCLSFYPGEGKLDSGRLEYGFMSQDKMYPNYYSGNVKGTLETEPGRLSYDIRPEDSENSYGISFDIGDNRVLCVSVEGEGELTGDYYPVDESFIYPDVYRRYLSKADLCMWPTEDLRLLRNEIYAVHGRSFNDQILSRYFSEKPWYRPILGSDEFTEELLTDVERKNIAFIREMESAPDRNVLDGQNRYGLEDLPFAPYLSWLGQNRETGLNADLSQARDMGAYYIVQGSISVPASVTQEQYEAVNAGGTAKVITDELTGEYQILELDPLADENPGYGYLLYKEGSAPENYGYETGVAFNYEKGVFHLWQTSCDTVMKRVYEGDIYILKGAMYGGDVSIAGASQSQTEIVPPGAGRTPDPYADGFIAGNELCYNIRGHFTGIYYIGD